MTLIQVVNARKTLNELLKEQKIPFALAYKIAKFIEFTNQDAKFFSENFKKLVTEYGTIDGDNYKVPNENASDFADAVENLGNTETDIVPSFYETDFDMFEVTGEQISNLLPIINTKIQNTQED